MEFFGPVTLRTRLVRRPKVMNRRLDRLIECAKCNRVKLMHSIQLRPHIPFRPSADMTIDATNASMRRCDIRDEFRFHYVMTLLPAKCDRFGIFVCPIAAKRAYEEKCKTQAKGHNKRATSARIIQVKDRIRRYVCIGRTTPASPLDQSSQKK